MLLLAGTLTDWLFAVGTPTAMVMETVTAALVSPEVLVTVNWKLSAPFAPLVGV